MIHARHLQHLFHVPAGACDAQRSARVLHLAGRHHDDPNSGAINMRHAGQVEDSLFPILADEAIRGILGPRRYVFATPGQMSSRSVP